MLGQRFWECIGNDRGNCTTRVSIKMSHLWLISSQFPNLVDPTNCRMSFLGVFPLYLELPMSERHVWGCIGNIRGNSMTHIFGKISHMWLISSQFPKLVDPTNCRYHNVFLLKSHISCFLPWFLPKKNDFFLILVCNCSYKIMCY